MQISPTHENSKFQGLRLWGILWSEGGQIFTHCTEIPGLEANTPPTEIHRIWERGVLFCFPRKQQGVVGDDPKSLAPVLRVFHGQRLCVPPAGFEPATHGVETHCSIHWATEACVQPMKATFHDNYHLTTVSSWCQEQLFQGCSKSLVKLFQVKGKTQDVFAGKSSLQMTLTISILDNHCGKCKHHPIKKHTIIL